MRLLSPALGVPKVFDFFPKLEGYDESMEKGIVVFYTYEASEYSTWTAYNSSAPMCHVTESVHVHRGHQDSRQPIICHIMAA